MKRGAKQHNLYDRNGYKLMMPSWGAEEDPERIWGLTAIILDNVLNKALLPLLLNSDVITDDEKTEINHCY